MAAISSGTKGKISPTDVSTLTGEPRLMRNGSYGDSAIIEPRTLLYLAREYSHPGVIMLGHANHPTVTHLFPQLDEIVAARGLHPVTLDEMFGTSRRTRRAE
jgi:peptidoglycan-N-acetylglucosamine deacetylase